MTGLSLLEIILLGVALSADAFAVTISNTFVYASESKRRLVLMPVMFGLFQGLMPLLGYFVGGLAAEVIERYAGIITLVILGIVGGNMIREGAEALLHPGEDEAEHAGPVAKRLTMVTILALTTLVLCLAALAMGRKLGEVLGDRAQVAGGIVLVLIGLKAFFA